jgi:hypothetical protein
MNARNIRDAIASLDQKSFNTREEAEDALYPLFAKAKLSSVFQGEGHRDLFDRLIRVGWVENTKGKWVYSLPSITVPTPDTVTTADSPKDAAFATELSLTVADIQLLQQIGKPGLTMTPALQNLINAGLVQEVFALTDKGRQALNATQDLKIKI